MKKLIIAFLVIISFVFSYQIIKSIKTKEGPSGAQVTNNVQENSIDFSKIVNSATLDANFTVNRAGYFIGIGAAPSTVFEVQGTSSASYFLTGNTIQVGGFSSVAYSRFGTDTTSHVGSITTTNDILVSGDLEVNASVAFDGLPTLSGAGNVLCVLTGGTIVQDDSPVTACSGASSLKVKYDIKTLDSVQSLEDILAMRPVSYKFKPDYKPKDKTTHLGLIAEEVSVVDPLLIEKDGELLGLKYVELVPKLIAAVQEQQKQIDQLKSNPNVVEGNFWASLFRVIKDLFSKLF